MNRTFSALCAFDNKDLDNDYFQVLSQYFSKIYTAVSPLYALELCMSKKPQLIIINLKSNKSFHEIIKKKISYFKSSCCILFINCEKRDSLHLIVGNNCITYELENNPGIDDFRKKIKSIKTKINKIFSFHRPLELKNNLVWCRKNHCIYKIEYVDKSAFSITSTEKLLMITLTLNKQKFITEEDLAHKIYSSATKESRKNLRTAIYRLKQKLGKELLLSSYGNGYKINV